MNDDFVFAIHRSSIHDLTDLDCPRANSTNSTAGDFDFRIVSSLFLEHECNVFHVLPAMFVSSDGAGSIFPVIL